MIKAIIFDIGGVITKPGLVSKLLNHYSEKLKIPRKNIESVVRHNIVLAQRGKITFSDLITKVAKHLKIKNIERLKKIALGLNRLDKKSAETIKKLKRKYKLYALTNHIDDWLEYEKKKFKLNTYFDRIFTSYEMGMIKPNIKIYKRVLKELKLEPSEVIFVDNQRTNIGGAKDAGMHAILFRSTDQLKEDLIELGVKI